MKLFSQIVRTAINVTVLPVAVARDAVFVLADAADHQMAPRTREQLRKIKDEASE